MTMGLPVGLGSLFGALLLLAISANSWAYRPFVSTDAAVADPQEVEIELGYFTLEKAKLIRAQGIPASYDLFMAEKLEALAGLKPKLVEEAERTPGSRVLEGQVTGVQQAIGAPKGRPAAAQLLREFAEDVRRNGIVARLIEKHGVRGVTVAK